MNLSTVLKKSRPSLDSLTKEAADSAMSGVPHGLKRVVDNATFQLSRLLSSVDPDVKKLIDAVCTIGDNTTVQINKVGNALHWQIGTLKGDVKDIRTIALSLTTELKKQTQGMLGEIALNALHSLKSPKGRRKIDSVMSALLDPNTKAKLKDAVNGAVQPVLDSVKAINKILIEKDAPVF